MRSEEYIISPKKTVKTKSTRRRKKKKSKKIFIVSLAAVCVLVSVIILFVYGFTTDKALNGVWVYDSLTKYEFADNNGAMLLEGLRYEFKYKIRGEKLIIDFTKDSISDCEYTYSVENDRLTFIGGEGTASGTYTLTKE